MKTAAAQLAHYTGATLPLALGICLVLCACGSAFPHPEWAQVDQADYVEVTSSPRPAPVEFVPPNPRQGAVWVDGSWEYVGDRYGWKAGTWAMVPSGLRRARWLLVRRKEDGQLFFAPSTWKDASGKTVDDSSWIHALGPAARARSRIDGTAVIEEPAAPPPMPVTPAADSSSPPPAPPEVR
ncbi:MAG: hypothetical protein U0270_33860 [Labilithrix sp.]